MTKYILIILLTLFGLNSYCQQGDSLIKVTEKLYMITGYGGNVTFLVTNEGVLVVDAGTVKRDGEKIENHIKAVTDKPIKYIILTHYHYDHAYGACGFLGNPVLIGHKKIITNLTRFGKSFLDMYIQNLEIEITSLKTKMDSLKAINNDDSRAMENEYNSQLEQLKSANETTILFPDITFNDELTIYLDTDTIRLIYPGKTHTDCNILVEFTNQNVLSTGDFFFNHCMPYIDFNANCDTKNWIKQINIYSDKGYDYIIPGHGNFAGVEDLFEQGKYLSELREEIKTRIDNNEPLEEIQTKIKMNDYRDYEFQFMLSSEIEAIFKELTER